MAQDSGGRFPWWWRLMPGLGALAGYRRSWLRGDLLAGVTVAAHLVPQVMAYAGVAGVPTGRRAVGDPARPRVVCVVRVLPTAVGRARVDDRSDDGHRGGPVADGDAGHYASLAAALAVTVGLVLTARAFTGRSDDEPGLDANQEFLALGAANLGAGALHGFPVSSSASRTALAASTGARSQGYSLVAGAMVLAVLLFLSPLLSRTPSAVLGALVVYAAVRMVDLAGFRRLASFRRRELMLALGCLAGVLVLDILYGVIVAVGLSVAELLTRVARPHDAVEGLVPGLAGMHDVDDYPQARTIPGLLVYRYDSPLFFANAEDLGRRALAAVDQQTVSVRWFVLKDLIFPTLPTAVAAYRKWNGER